MIHLTREEFEESLIAAFGCDYAEGVGGADTNMLYGMFWVLPFTISGGRWKS
jgi:hypothetical protein